ncbi:dethiobiotin synthase [Putridiphycobacter roseus]|uniref:ATP-dependent dethiobiotin synthetase BioD n=1 Tax=Putridiphycobacter roseus TaxID=2219161 RepID=A0A2W1NNS3_9FLAO|nr:dethiobiotin synthase [Putridiphycobacter roseus]PZE17292.1 dethiobiotin synthase [Putridiphycobacter roseus]
MKQKVIGITGIGTDVGKTVVAAIIAEKLKADYYKLVQAGDLNALDSEFVKLQLSNDISVVHKTGILLSQPMSPHAAAKMDGLSLQVEDFTLPETQNQLIVEGAGGVLVPINENGQYIIDVMAGLVDEVILVSRHYLGSINHTLLSIHFLQSKNIPIKGIVFVGEENLATESIIAANTQIKILGRVAWAQVLDQEFIQKAGKKIDL